jgi:hypothetical protein
MSSRMRYCHQRFYSRIPELELNLKTVKKAACRSHMPWPRGRMRVRIRERRDLSFAAYPRPLSAADCVKVARERARPAHDAHADSALAGACLGAGSAASGSGPFA